MSTTHQSILQVEGMTCHSCVRHVDAALRDVDGVNTVEVALDTGRVVVGHDPHADVACLVEALEAAGYPAHPTS